MFLLDRLDFRLPNHANKGSLKKYEKRTGAVYNWFAQRILRQKTASAALKILAYGWHRLAFSPCICHFLTQNPLRKPIVNSP